MGSTTAPKHRRRTPGPAVCDAGGPLSISAVGMFLLLRNRSLVFGDMPQRQTMARRRRSRNPVVALRDVEGADDGCDGNGLGGGELERCYY